MFVTAQGEVDIDNKNVVIPVTTDKNSNNSWKNIYEEVDEDYFK